MKKFCQLSVVAVLMAIVLVMMGCGGGAPPAWDELFAIERAWHTTAAKHEVQLTPDVAKKLVERSAQVGISPDAIREMDEKDFQRSLVVVNGK